MRALLAWTVLVSCSASAQNNWEDAGMPFNSVGVRQLYADTAQNRLLAVGPITLSTDLAFPVIAAFDPSGWIPITGIEYGGIYTVIRYGDTLVVGGYFHQIDGIPIDLVGAWYDSAWHAFGAFQTDDGVVRNLQIVGGSLYAVGAFLSVDGNICHGVAKRVGGQWENLGSIDYPVGDEPIVLDVCEYQGNIVVGGEMNPIGLGNDLIQFDGTNWVDVGGGLQGGVGAVTAMAVYHSELYVGGGLYVGAGSPGHGLVRWNGSEWRDVGGSMRDIYGTTNYNASASRLLVHDGKLLVGGAFGYAGTVHANQFAIWDGESWCATGDSIGAKVESMAFYHDTLFITCSDSLNGQPANYIARWVGGSFEQNCEQVSITEQAAMPEEVFTVGSSDGGGRSLSGLPDGKVQLQVFDATGRLISTEVIVSVAGRARMHVQEQTEGLYLMQAEADGYRGMARFVSTR